MKRASTMIECIDPDSLVDAIAAAVLDRMRAARSETSSPLLVDGDEMARLSGVSRPMIDRLRADGIIPSVQIGRCRRYRPEAVISALEAANAKGNDRV